MSQSSASASASVSAAAADDPLMERAVWLACAGPFARLPSIGTQVYYFPRGHADQCRGATLPHLPHDAAVLCTVNSIELRYHQESDAPYALISLQPGQQGGPAQPPAPAAPDHEDRAALGLEYYVKHLTGTREDRAPFVVPKPCAVALFPPLVGPSQELHMVDVHGKPLSFSRSISDKGSNRLTTNWIDYFRDKKLKMGEGKDGVIFMRRAQGQGGLIIASRRGEPSSELALGLVNNFQVVEIARAVAADLSFTVAYYPRQGWPFVVPRKEVDDALQLHWQPGMRVRMPVPEDDHELQSSKDRSKTPPFYLGVIDVVNDTHWCKLQVNWVGNYTPDRNVNVWQVEAMDAVEPSSNAPSSALATGSSDAPPSSSAPTGSITLFGKTLKTGEP